MPRATAPEPLVHDWNSQSPGEFPSGVALLDETLRDGLQSPSVRQPALARKTELLGLMEGVGLEVAKIGIPASSARMRADCVELARHAAAGRYRIALACSSRALPEDVAAVRDVAERSGAPVEAYVFVASSALRVHAEGWDTARVRGLLSSALDETRRAGLRSAFVAEDASRGSPELVSELVRLAVDRGASRICLCDTAGHATPEGARALVAFTRSVVRETGADVGIDWHGHDDRGLGLANALAAASAGATRLHGTALGVGERAGNVAMELLVVNLALRGSPGARRPERLVEYCKAASRALGFAIPEHHPLVGRNAFRTATGTHAAALLKAEHSGDPSLAGRVYGAVPPEWLGRRAIIEIGALSGEHAVVHWLEHHGVRVEPELVRRVLDRAKNADRVLTDEEVWALVRRPAPLGAGKHAGRTQ